MKNEKGIMSRLKKKAKKQKVNVVAVAIRDITEPQAIRSFLDEYIVDRRGYWEGEDKSKITQDLLKFSGGLPNLIHSTVTLYLQHLYSEMALVKNDLVNNWCEALDEKVEKLRLEYK